MTDAEELEQLRQMRRSLTKDPEIRKEFQRVLKKAIPTALTPDLDQDESLTTRLQKELEARDAKIQALEEARLRNDLSKQYQDQKDKLAGPPYNFDPDDIAEVEKLIKEKEFPSYEVAAQYYQALNGTAKPSGLGLGGTTRSKSVREHRKAFNDRYKGVFKRPGSGTWQATFDDAYEKVRTGQYLKE
jgi:hypothetical protein